MGIIAASRLRFVYSDFILDNFPANAAYSFRLLSSNYSGNCLRIRRSNDDSVLDINFLNGTLNIKRLMEFVGSNTGYINILYDHSGNNIDLIQNDFELQPILVNNGVLQKNNNLPAINSGLRSGSYLESLQTYDVNSASFISVYNKTTNNGTRVSGFRSSILNASKTFAQEVDNSIRFDGSARAGSITPILGNEIRYSEKHNNILLDYINGIENINLSIIRYTDGNLNILNPKTDLTGSPGGYWHETIFWFNSKKNNRILIEENINNYYNFF
jgi:hypothetical protein